MRTAAVVDGCAAWTASPGNLGPGPAGTMSTTTSKLRRYQGRGRWVYSHLYRLHGRNPKHLAIAKHCHGNATLPHQP